jgi:hypothetical protein
MASFQKKSNRGTHRIHTTAFDPERIKELFKLGWIGRGHQLIVATSQGNKKKMYIYNQYIV